RDGRRDVGAAAGLAAGGEGLGPGHVAVAALARARLGIGPREVDAGRDVVAVLVGVGGEGGLHEVHPDRQRDAAAGAARAELAGRDVVADPHARGDARRVADEPGVAVAVGGAG